MGYVPGSSKEACPPVDVAPGSSVRRRRHLSKVGLFEEVRVVVGLPPDRSRKLQVERLLGLHGIERDVVLRDGRNARGVARIFSYSMSPALRFSARQILHRRGEKRIGAYG